MKYTIVINTDEREEMGSKEDIDDVGYEVRELLRSGYFEVESIEEIPSKPTVRRTKEGKMAFAKAWDKAQSEGRKMTARDVDQMLDERFDGAPGWEEF